MDNIELAKDLLERLNMPAKQQAQLCCLTLLAMAKIKPDMPWREATNDWIRIHDVMSFISENYGITYAENSRETFRKQAMHPFRTAALIEDNGKATNIQTIATALQMNFLQLCKQ